MSQVPQGPSSRSCTKPMAADSERPKLTLRHLLRPHATGLMIGVVAALVESAANLAEPWPLKVVLDNVLKSKSAHGWLNQLIFSAGGTDKVAILKFAALAVLAIAAVAAVSSYTDKYTTTSLTQCALPP